MKDKIYNWGVLATGRIAHSFADAFKFVKDGRLSAVASRTQKKADDFAREYQMPKAYGSYKALYDDRDVDIIYIATPHNFHYENTKAALNAGKHVLCEKAFTLNAKQAGELVELARSKNLFLMEAMWNRFQPVNYKVREILESGILGEVMHINADLSFNFPYDPQHRLFNPGLGGGSLLDLGVYPVSYVSMIWGSPNDIISVVHKAPTGMDDQVNAILLYPNGKTAQVLCSTRFQSPTRVDILGTKGRLQLHEMIIRSSRITLTLEKQEPQIIDCPYEGNAYQYQAIAVMDMLQQGKTEHPLMPLDESISIMETMDKIRYKSGIFYPDEKQ